MQSQTTTFKCTYCCKNEEKQYLEAVSQIPDFRCTQEFILKTQKGKDGELLSPTDLICITHEEQFELKYASFQRGGKFSTEFNPKYRKRNELLNPTPCAYCQELSRHVPILF